MGGRRTSRAVNARADARDGQTASSIALLQRAEDGVKAELQPCGYTSMHSD